MQIFTCESVRSVYPLIKTRILYSLFELVLFNWSEIHTLFFLVLKRETFVCLYCFEQGEWKFYIVEGCSNVFHLSMHRVVTFNAQFNAQKAD